MSITLVPPDYPLNPSTCRIAVIGQNPGKTEVDPNVLKPFQGYSGNLLKKWWADLGIRREEVYIDNLIPYLCMPEKLEKKELDHWAGELHKRLATLPGLNVIVPTGDYATKALIGKGKWNWEKGKKGKKVEADDDVGITKLRGSIYPYISMSGRQLKVIPTLHPSAMFDRGSGKGMGVTKYILERRVIRDWQRIIHESQTPQINEPKRAHFICQGEEQARWFIDRLQEAETDPCAAMSVDIETPSGALDCIGFSFDTRWSFTFPTFTRRELDTYLPYIVRSCSSPISKVFQNGLYDTYWLRYYGIHTNNYIWDLMYAHGIIAPTDNHALDYLSSIYLPFHRYWKDEAKGEEAKKYATNHEALCIYNGMDNCIQRELFDYIKADLDARSLTSFYFTHVALLLEPLLETSLCGILVNREKLKALREVSISNVQEIRKELEQLAGEDLIAKSGFSPPKLMKYFHETLGLPKVFKLTKKKDGKSKSATLDAMALAKLANAYPAKALKPAQLCVDYRAETKQVESWLNEEKLDGDGRVRCQYSPTTEAGRLSSKSNPRGTGYNLQNTKTREKAWRRDKGNENIRSIYIPDPGCLLVECDLSQAEDRLGRMYCRSERMIEIANRHPADFDIHNRNAGIIFAKEFKVGDKFQRFMGKKVCHGSWRGLGGKKMSDQLLTEEDMIVPASQCQGMIDTLMHEDWEIRDNFHPWVREQIMTKGYLVNSWGRVWDVRGESFNDDLYRRGYSFPMQADCADHMNQWGFIPVYHFLKCNYNLLHARINIQRHDALIMSVPFEYVYDVVKFTLDSLQRPKEIMGNMLVIPSTIKVGLNDAEGKEWKRLPDKSNFLMELEAYLKEVNK